MPISWKKKFVKDWGQLGMKYKIGEICESVSCTFRNKQKDVILINTSDVFDGKVTNHKYVTNEKLRGQFKKAFIKDDILYSEIRPKNRRFAYVDFIADDYIASTKLMVIRAKKDKILPKFLFQILKSNPIIERLQLLAETRSGTFPQITFSELAAIEVCVPTIKEQNQIVDFMSSFDNKINNNYAINQRLEKTAQEIYKSWFMNFDPFQGDIFIESALGRIPNGWTVDTLSTFCDFISRGITPKYIESGEQIVINQKCIRDHQVNLGPSRFHVPKVINEKWLQYGDVLVNSTGQGTLGRVAQWLETSTKVTVDSHVSIVRPSEKYYIYYIGQVLISKEREIEAMAAGSTGQTELSRERLGSLLLVHPKIEQLEKFSKIIEPLLTKIVMNNHESEKIAKIRDLLLPKLMSGELPISYEGLITNERSSDDGRT